MRITDHFIPVIVDDLDASIAAYENQLGVLAAKRWTFEAMGLELCVVRPFVLVTAPVVLRAEISNLRAVLKVDDLAEIRNRLLAAGVPIKWELDTPAGPAVYAQPTEEMLVEYIQPRLGWTINQDYAAAGEMLGSGMRSQ